MRALADFCFAASVHNANHLYFLLRCLVVSGLIGIFGELSMGLFPSALLRPTFEAWNL